MLRIESLTKLYLGTDKGVRELTLHVSAGELCAFIGPNGAGKTTTLRAIAGIHPADAGRIIIDGIDLAADPIAAKRSLAYIPDEPELYGYLTGAQYLAFVADIYGVPDAERKARLDALVGSFGLEEALGTLISTYSHGMRRKLALTSALRHRRHPAGRAAGDVGRDGGGRPPRRNAGGHLHGGGGRCVRFVCRPPYPCGACGASGDCAMCATSARSGGAFGLASSGRCSA